MVTTIEPEAAPFSLEGKRVWVAGHRGMVGSAVVRRLAREDCVVLTATRHDVDLRQQAAVEAWLDRERPDVIVLAAATVGGILANSTRPAEFIYNNLAIEANIIHGAHRVGVDRLRFLGSTCIYPKFAPQPMPEDCLLTSALEPTNQWYAIAKISGIKLCQAYRRQYGRRFISAMPTNLYGPNDNYDLNSSHVLPALIRKIHDAKTANADSVEIWGSGTPRREFLHADDLADALIFLLRGYDGETHVNVGSGVDIPISEVAELIAKVVGYQGRFRYDASKPDGAPRKLVDVSFLNEMGWRARIGLEEGVADAYRWMLENRQRVYGDAASSA